MRTILAVLGEDSQVESGNEVSTQVSLSAADERGRVPSGDFGPRGFCHSFSFVSKGREERISTQDVACAVCRERNLGENVQFLLSPSRDTTLVEIALPCHEERHHPLKDRDRHRKHGS